jgi:hypothetical protein
VLIVEANVDGGTANAGMAADLVPPTVREPDVLPSLELRSFVVIPKLLSTMIMVGTIAWMPFNQLSKVIEASNHELTVSWAIGS